MAKVEMAAIRGAGSSNGSQTVYGAVGMAGFYAISNQTTESRAQTRYRTAGVLSRLWLYIQANNRGASTAQIRKSGVNGNGTISIGASATGLFQDAVNTDTVAAGDLVNHSIAIGAGGTSFIDRKVGACFTATAAVTVTPLMAGPSVSYSTDSATFYLPIGGGTPGTSLEADIEFLFRSSATLRNGAVNVRTNSRTTATTLTLRKNGANGAVTISISASGTGQFEDTTNSDSVADGDLCAWSLVTSTGGGTITVESVKIELETTDNRFYFASCSRGGLSLSAGAATDYGTLSGTIAELASGTEARVQHWAGSGFVLDRFNLVVQSNGLTASSTVRTRVNAANGAQLVSIGSGATGRFEDTSNRDIIQASDLVNVAFEVGATGTTIVFGQLGARATVAGGVEYRRFPRGVERGVLRGVAA